MTLDEAILHAREKAREKMLEYENHYDKDEHILEKADDYEKRINKHKYSQLLH